MIAHGFMLTADQPIEKRLLAVFNLWRDPLSDRIDLQQLQSGLRRCVLPSVADDTKARLLKVNSFPSSNLNCVLHAPCLFT